MKQPSRIRFVDKKIKQAFDKLEDGDRQEQDLYKFINQALDNLEENAYCGARIQKKQIPKEYKKKYGVPNLWKYDLPKGWRLIYSVIGDEIQVISLVLEWFDHKKYERRFKY